ncbi:hypothetical protein K2V56_10455 [Staphylococcus chromogenes]|uniref:hypothetical protein n=1 Tax=Staphylococcus chromogenes TaxID=46126 RepID=UPI001E51CBFA|nr:hypothetical protein [Staphylococcus chromogenes]MCD8905904.1 hypothetical protein [Staphylococcus chromogenes]
MATVKQVEFVKSLQSQCGLSDDESYTEKQIIAMSHKEVSKVIDELLGELAQQNMYNDCMSNGLPNQ